MQINKNAVYSFSKITGIYCSRVFMNNIIDDEVVEGFEDEFVEADESLQSQGQVNHLSARKRLEAMIEDKRLRDDLDDFLDY